MAVSHAAGRGGLAGVGARIVPWRQLAIEIINVSDRLTAPPRPIYFKFLYDKAYYILCYISCYIVLQMYDIIKCYNKYSVIHSTSDIEYDIIY
jgi:hypothetical protein